MEFNPLELDCFLSQAKFWMKCSWNELWEEHIVEECQTALDPVLVTRLKRKIDFETSNWEDFKSALQEISLLTHSVLKRRYDVFTRQQPKESLSVYITRIVNLMNVAHLEGGLNKDEVGILVIMT